MATIEELSAALVKADAAGNAADAKVFADEIRRLRAAAAPPPPSDTGIPGPRQILSNIAGGLVRGAGSIGATLIRPFESGEENVQRRQAMDAALRELIGAQPESAFYKGGQLAGEIAGTAGVGGALAAPLKLVGRLAPAAAPYVAPAATALETGGFQTGLTGRPVASLATRIAGGAAGGAAAAGLVNPEEAATGGVVGGVIGAAGPATVKALAKGAGALSDALAGRVAEVRAGKIARDAAGDQINAIRAALTAAPQDINAAQATTDIPRQAWQALGSIASNTDRNFLLLKQQQDNRLAELARMAAGANATEARAIQEESTRILNDLTAASRRTELGAANEAARVLNRLAPQAAQKQASMVSALQTAGRTETEAAQRAAAAAAQLERVAPGEIPSVSARQAARTQAAASNQFADTATTFGEIAAQRRAERDFIERQIGSLEAHGLRPLDAQPIISAIESKIRAPGTRASSTQVKVLQAIRDDLQELTAKGGGAIDAHDLYTLRKEGLNERIAGLLGTTDPKVSSKVTAKILTDVKPMIDDAIEKAGGTGWRDYLKTYEQGMHSVEQKIMAAEAMRLFKNSPNEYVKLVRGDNEAAVEAIFGPGKYNIFKEMAGKMPTLEKIASEVERNAAMEKMAQGGARELKEIIEKNQLSARLPNLFSRAATAGNVTLAVLEKRVNRKTMDILREGMANGKSALDVLDTLPTVERNRVLKVLVDPANWAGAKKAPPATVAGAVTGNALAPESQNRNALAQ